MTDIKVYPVSGSVSVEGVNMNPTYLQVERNNDIQPSKAKVKGHIDEPEKLSKNDIITVSVKSSGLERDLFTGQLKSASQNKEGVVEIIAFDEIYNMKNTIIKYNSPGPEPVRDVIQQILEASGYTVSSDYNTLNSGDVYLAPEEDLVNFNITSKKSFGEGEQGENLITVLEHLTKSICGLAFYTDRNSIVRIESYPNYSLYYPQYIINLNSGEQTTEKKRTLVQGGTASSFLGLGASHMRTPQKIAGESELPSEDGEPLNEDEVIVDKTVSTQDEANNVATTDALRRSNSRSAGTITITGDPRIELFDDVIIEDLETKVPDYVLETTSYANGLFNNLYTVRGVTTIIDSSEGYTTELDLTPSHRSVAQDISSTGNLGDLFADQIGGPEKIVEDSWFEND